METTQPRRFRKVGITLFIIALLGTLVAVVHLVENVRGKKQWESYKRRLIAQGAKLDLAGFVPPLIAPDQNFAATPLFAELLPRRPTNWNAWPILINKLQPKVKTKRNERQITDLAAWEVALRADRGDTNATPLPRAKAAEELLAAMKIYEPVLQELRAAGERPWSRYNIEYDLDNPWGIHLPHLVVLKQICQTLSVKASAELAVGNSEQAMEEVRLMLRVGDSMQTELFLITYLVRVACFQIAMQAVWEGLALDRWSDAQLEELQRRLLAYNFIDELQMPFGAERAAGILTADILLRQRDKPRFLAALMGPDASVPPFGALAARLIPRGWYHMEQYNYTRLFQDYVLPGADGTNRVVYPAIAERNTAQLDKILREPWSPILSHYLFAKLLLPAVNKTHRRAAQAQTAAHQAAIACALQRYRRAHGSYPGELAALTPQFMTSIPQDVIGGKPMRYQATRPIVLSSIGWDDADNDGKPGLDLWAERGDWVWTYPAE